MYNINASCHNLRHCNDVQLPKWHLLRPLEPRGQIFHMFQIFHASFGGQIFHDCIYVIITVAILTLQLLPSPIHIALTLDFCDKASAPIKPWVKGTKCLFFNEIHPQIIPLSLSLLLSAFPCFPLQSHLGRTR